MDNFKACGEEWDWRELCRVVQRWEKNGEKKWLEIDKQPASGEELFMPGRRVKRADEETLKRRQRKDRSLE